MARVIETSFARREPQVRHLRPPKLPPAGLLEAWHTDPFGSEPFGLWTTESLLSWFIRLVVLTDPTGPRSTIQINAGGPSPIPGDHGSAGTGDRWRFE